ncbi:hypothetical protein MAR_015781 [Mya arenaria]|uniref:Uncharacterized protein n=1 Tax=Mya arenaria TaxID=6604 RepID=A0ABY7FL85_MYAAR|nr:hypothetical protein MAR_015781 [Mya arenaria]
MPIECVEIVRSKLRAQQKNYMMYMQILEMLKCPSLKFVCNIPSLQANFQAYQKLRDEHASQAWYFEHKAKSGETISEDKRNVEINFLYEAFGCNKKLVELVYEIADELQELVCMDVTIPSMPANQIYQEFPELLSQHTDRHQPITSLCDHLTKNYDLNFDDVCRRVVWVVALERKGKDVSHIKEAPQEYRPNKINYRPTFRAVKEEEYTVLCPITENIFRPEDLYESPALMQCLENFHEKYEEFLAQEFGPRPFALKSADPMKGEGKFTKPIPLVPFPEFWDKTWSEEPVPCKSLEDRKAARLAGNLQVPKADLEKPQHDLEEAIKLLCDAEDASSYQYGSEICSKPGITVQNTVKHPYSDASVMNKCPANPDSALTPLDEGFVKAASKSKPLASVKRAKPEAAFQEISLVGSDHPHVYANKRCRIAFSPPKSSTADKTSVLVDNAKGSAHNAGVLASSQRSDQVKAMQEKQARLAGWFSKQSAVVHKQAISAFAKEQSRKRKAMNTPEYFKRAAKCAKLAPLVAVAAPELVSAHRVTALGVPRVTAPARPAKRPSQERIILKVNKGKNSYWTSRRVVNPGRRGS